MKFPWWSWTADQSNDTYVLLYLESRVDSSHRTQSSIFDRSSSSLNPIDVPATMATSGEKRTEIDPVAKRIAVPTSLDEFLPSGLGDISDLQRAIPRIAKDRELTGKIEQVLRDIPTKHDLRLGDCRKMELETESVHLVVTSPPYWTLKEYNRCDGQLGYVEDYEEFLTALDEVWQRCYDALVPGGRLICVVGDVCLSRRKNGGRHMVVPLHASIQTHCADIGYDNLAPIIWYKIANAQMEATGNGSAFLGKPYEPNAVIKNDIEFILMQRKSGGYRSPDMATKILSIIPEDSHREWFQQIWSDVKGASTRAHPAPYPLELALRLIRMFSFVGDTVVDPFLGTGTTSAAAAQCGRNSIGFEIDPDYLDMAKKRFHKSNDLFSSASLTAR